MIERLTSNLDALARLAPSELATERGSRVAADCADAIRLYTRLGFRPVTGTDAAAFVKLGDDCEQAFRLDLQY